MNDSPADGSVLFIDRLAEPLLQLFRKWETLQDIRNRPPEQGVVLKYHRNVQNFQGVGTRLGEERSPLVKPIFLTLNPSDNQKEVFDAPSGQETLDSVHGKQTQSIPCLCLSRCH